MQLYGETHHPKWLDIVRMLLGIIILLRGYYYVRNNHALMTLLDNNNVHLYNNVIEHVIALTHLMGGGLIILGLITRLACLFQVPILFAAVIFVNKAPSGLLSPNPEFLLALITLLLLIFFVIYGPGPWSVDKLIDKNRKNWDNVDI